MEIKDSYERPLSKERVWAALNDEDFLKKSIPWCEKLVEDKDPTSTTLSYEVSAQVKGKIAQLGSRLIQSTAKKLSKNFFGSFVKQLEDMDKP